MSLLIALKMKNESFLDDKAWNDKINGLKEKICGLLNWQEKLVEKVPGYGYYLGYYFRCYVLYIYGK